MNLGILLDVYFHCSLSLYTVVLLRLRLLSFCRCVRVFGVVGRRATTVAWLLGVSVANNNKIQGIQVSLRYPGPNLLEDRDPNPTDSPRAHAKRLNSDFFCSTPPFRCQTRLAATVSSEAPRASPTELY